MHVKRSILQALAKTVALLLHRSELAVIEVVHKWAHDWRAIWCVRVHLGGPGWRLDLDRSSVLSIVEILILMHRTLVVDHVILLAWILLVQIAQLE